MPGEILTLQFGNFANYVGSHYWNLQDELLGLQEQQGPHGSAWQIDSSVLYRQGETLHGESTYTPRLVLWDLSGALGGASAGGFLYGGHAPPAATMVATWTGRQEVHRATPVAPSRFLAELENEATAEGGEAAAGGISDQEAAPSAVQAAARQLDSGDTGPEGGGVRYFTDYLKAHLHPRSIQQLKGAWHGLTPFAAWGDGSQQWASEEQREEMMERVRYFAEEADHLQGFQALAQDVSGWGGLATHVLQELRDEYGGNRPVMLFALRSDSPPSAAAEEAEAVERRRRQLNEGLSLAQLAPLCSTYTVVSPPPQAALPLLRWRPGSLYHTSAICAAALDTATLPYRLTAGEGPDDAIGSVGMWDLAQLITSQHGSPLAALSLAMPCPMLGPSAQHQAQQADNRLQRAQPAELGGGVAEAGGPFLTRHLASLTPGIQPLGDTGRFSEAVVLRGPRAKGAAMSLRAAADCLDMALTLERQRCMRHRTLAAMPLAVPLPFPPIFASGMSQHGDVPAAAKLGAGRQEVSSCSVLTRLAATSSFAGVVAATRQQFNMAAHSMQGEAMLQSWGLGREELREAEEQLQQLGHAYEDTEP